MKVKFSYFDEWASCLVYQHLYPHAVFTDYERQNKIFYIAGCALGLSKSIRYSVDFVIAGFVSTYFTVILPGFHMLFVITGFSL